MTDKTKPTFDTPFLDRATLTEHSDVVEEAQRWFDRLIELYHEGVRQKKHGYGQLIINRALFICILNHSNTVSISKTDTIEHGGELYFIDSQTTLNEYIIGVSDDFFYAGGVSDGKGGIVKVGDDGFQIEGFKIAIKIKRLGFFNFLKNHSQSSENTISSNRALITRILEKIGDGSLESIMEVLKKITEKSN